MHGLIVRHERLGIGKIKEIAGHAIKVQFRGADGKTTVLEFGKGSLRDGTLRRVSLSIGTPCLYGKQVCKIKSVLGTTTDSNSLSQYELVNSDHQSVVVTETQIEPLPVQSNISPYDAVLESRFDEYSLFRKREALSRAYQELVAQGAGIRALLSSRVDLLPHQAYVAGVVLGDPVRRYVLADEVGLGKTIEAGIVAHDLLIRNPRSKILVICPGALTQQWLCEIYSKFGGHVFRLIDRYPAKELLKSMFDRCIVSFTRTAFEIPRYMVQRASEDPWDLVIVDEAHQLLASSVLYSVVKQISTASPSVLLLSAIPAQKREDELRQLLNLLEPGRYEQDTEAFSILYDAQPQIGRRLRILERRILGLSDGEFEPVDLLDAASKLSDTSVVQGDEQVQTLVRAIHNAQSKQDVVQGGNDLLHYVAEMYRINRRIVRNRRDRLVEKDQIAKIDRLFLPVPYNPDQAEIEALSCIDTLVEKLWRSNAHNVVKTSAIRVLYHSAVWPTTLAAVLEEFANISASEPTPAQLDILRIGFSGSYHEWKYYIATIASGLKAYLDDAVVRRTVRAARNWFEHGNSQRYKTLLQLLKKRVKEESLTKFIVFAGLDGLAQDIARGLRQDLNEFGSTIVTEFRHNLPDEEKERNVRDFQTKPLIRVMISDESGGEGRNFQFADEIIHFDTPWFVGRIEQRIGRLDRLGRSEYSTQVRSSVLFPTATTESSLIECFEQGFGVYTHSISGLEFALRDAEDGMAKIVGKQGHQGLSEYVLELKKIAQEERLKDESEAVMDIASFDKVRAASILGDGEGRQVPSLENSFVEYFKKNSAAKSVRDFQIDGTHSRGWEFQADGLKFSNVVADLKGTAVQFRGTFHRKVAQFRPDLQFFCVGNPLFDSVIRSLRSDVVGRVFAISIGNPESDAWSGFELVFSPRLLCKTELVGNSLTFDNKSVSVFVDCDAKVSEHGEELLLLRRTANRSQVTDISARVDSVLPSLIGTADWQRRISEIFNVGREEAGRRLETRIQPELEAERGRLTDLLTRLGPDASEQSRSDYQKAINAMEKWEVELDSVGLLAVNTLPVNS